MQQVSHLTNLFPRERLIAKGGNTALLLEDAPAQVVNDKRDPRSHHIVAISAKSKYSLKQNVMSLLETLDKSQVDLPSLSYTVRFTLSRKHMICANAV